MLHENKLASHSAADSSWFFHHAWRYNNTK